MYNELRIVDNRVFLLGLDKLYRDAMKQHERGELLNCARLLTQLLHAPLADAPVDGYYAEDEQLTEYFRLLRALQEVDAGAASSVNSLPEFRRLLDVTCSPLFGRPQHSGKLLPAGRDALSQALFDTFPDWTVAGLVGVAGRQARESGEISLVALAARVQDPVVMAATRESVVLYAEPVPGAALSAPSPTYDWEVDEDLAQNARRFIDTFNTLFYEKLPPPEPAQAERYWLAYDENEIFGRCVRLGYDDSCSPTRHYHWAIYCAADGALAVQDFWKTEVWTTSRYRMALCGRGPCLQL